MNGRVSDRVDGDQSILQFTLFLSILMNKMCSLQKWCQKLSTVFFFFKL